MFEAFFVLMHTIIKSTPSPNNMLLRNTRGSRRFRVAVSSKICIADLCSQRQEQVDFLLVSVCQE